MICVYPPPPFSPCSVTCGDAARVDAGVSIHITVTGGDGSGTPIGNDSIYPIEPQFAGILCGAAGEDFIDTKRTISAVYGGNRRLCKSSRAPISVPDSI